jgi:hypothetical protein
MSRLSVAEFEARFQALTRSLDAGDNEQCVECVRSLCCSRCTFCVESERLVGCHYCVRCRAATDCSHCRESERLVDCHHCIECADCIRSSYLVRCSAMSGCSYCFGCVGLARKDFHILNQPYSRQEYFQITGELGRSLRLSG